MDYDINLNAENLANSTGNLATFNQELSNNIESIKFIANEIKSNWTNDTLGNDINTSLSKLNECIDKINTVVFPVLNQYVETMNTLAVSVSTTAKKEVSVNE